MSVFFSVSRSSFRVSVPPVFFIAKMALFARLLSIRSSAAGSPLIFISWSSSSAEMWMFEGSVSWSFFTTSSMMRKGENTMASGAVVVFSRSAFSISLSESLARFAALVASPMKLLTFESFPNSWGCTVLSGMLERISWASSLKPICEPRMFL